MDKKSFYNLIDFGSSKIRFATFDFDLNPIFSETKKINLNETFENRFEVIGRIIKNAEKKISSHVEDVILSLDNVNIFVIDISLNKNLDLKSQINNIYDILILELKQIISSNYDNHHLAHIIVDKCIIDNQFNFNVIPKNKIIFKNIKVDFKVICFPNEIIKTIKENFIKKNLNITKILCTSYIKSQSYVKKLNITKVSFLEIGWKRSSLLLYENYQLKFIRTIPVGGFHITKDISKIFKISENDSEKLKKSFNKSDTEFSYESNSGENLMLFKEILNKNISVNKLKKVILYRVQEIIDLSFKKLNNNHFKKKIENTELYLIGDGSLIFNDNSFYLNDNFDFKSISFYSESDINICNCGLKYHLANLKSPQISRKKQGLFEKFFNYFGK